MNKCQAENFQLGSPGDLLLRDCCHLLRLLLLKNAGRYCRLELSEF